MVSRFGYWLSYLHLKCCLISRYGCGSSLSSDLMAADSQKGECTLVFTAGNSNILVKLLYYLLFTFGYESFYDRFRRKGS